MVWVETPTNPLMKWILPLAKSLRQIIFCLPLILCNTVLQNPLDLGVDVVMHSATKYLAGHSDVVAGALI
jgi:cystathionine beta-lyase